MVEPDPNDPTAAWHPGPDTGAEPDAHSDTAGQSPPDGGGRADEGRNQPSAGLHPASESPTDLGADAEDGRNGPPADPEIGPESPSDGTLAGYIAQHGRPPAFEGSDAQPYTVEVDVDETGDPEHPYAAFLVFLRWAGNASGVMEHLESRDIAHGESEAEARRAGLALTLYRVKTELDAAIERRRDERGW